MREKIQAFFANISLFQAALSAYQLIQTFPGLALENEALMRSWLLSWIPIARSMAETTETDHDDKIIDGAESILNEDAAWSFVWKIIAAGKGLKVANAPDSLPEAADPEVQLSVSWLLQLWCWINQLLELVRKANGDQDAAQTQNV